MPFSVGRDLVIEIAEHRIVFQKMRERLRVRQIVDGDEIDVRVAEATRARRCARCARNR